MLIFMFKINIIFILKIEINHLKNSKFKNKTNLYSRRVVGDVVVDNRRSVAQKPVGDGREGNKIVREEEEDESKVRKSFR